MSATNYLQPPSSQLHHNNLSVTNVFTSKMQGRSSRSVSPNRRLTYSTFLKHDTPTRYGGDPYDNSTSSNSTTRRTASINDISGGFGMLSNFSNTTISGDSKVSMSSNTNFSNNDHYIETSKNYRQHYDQVLHTHHGLLQDFQAWNDDDDDDEEEEPTIVLGKRGILCGKGRVGQKQRAVMTSSKRTSVGEGKSNIVGNGRCCKTKKGQKMPDHNNNFLSAMSQQRFLQNHTIPTDDEETRFNRLCQLAQPKFHHCIHHRQTCAVHCKAPKKMDSETMARIEWLAQPKLSYYTVCSCCQSPNCLGECSTRFNVNKTNVTDPRQVDWDRLATPRKIPSLSSSESSSKSRPRSRPSTPAVGGVSRLDKLSLPRKVIDSGDYYLWLWNKKPDTHVYLKPIKRLYVAKCDLKDIRMLLRCDLDFTRGKSIDEKVRDALPTMQMALKKGAKSIVIVSRCGPQDEQRDDAYSLRPLAQVFEQYLNTRVIFLDDCVGFQAQALCEDPVPGSVFLLENLSFHPEEIGYFMENNEKKVCSKESVKKFQKILLDHGDIYITDSFTELVHMTNTTCKHPNKEFGYGFNIRKELKVFGKFAHRPPVPVLAIVSGPFDKTWPVVRNLMGQVNDILIGGHVSSVFLRIVKGILLGQTVCTEKMETRARNVFSRAKDTETTLHLPSDVVVRNTSTGEYFVALTRDDIDECFEIVDIGPHTRQCYINTIREAAAILWLGEMGPLSDGTEVIKEAYLEAAKAGTPTYAADDTVKKFICDISRPEECLFVTGDGDATESLLRGKIPKGIACMSKQRKKIKVESHEIMSNKPLAYELPGMVIPGGSKAGLNYGISPGIMCINHIPLENLKVLVRVEFNEPTQEYLVTNNYRMRMTIPTIKYALKWGARAVIILAHFREPQGKRDTELSLKPVCDELATLLGETVMFVPRTVGKDVVTTINQSHHGSTIMLENVRFHSEEEYGFLHPPDGRIRPAGSLKKSVQSLAGGYQSELNAQFCEELSRLGDVYVNDAFAALHLDHASVTGNMRPTRVCGFLIKNELKYLAKLLNYPNRKFLVIIGGTNMDDKLAIMPGILKEADSVILAGSLAVLFLKVEHGLKTGRMTLTEKLQQRAKEIIELAQYYKCRIHYPVDLTVSQDIEGKNSKQVSISEGIPKGHVFVDIGNLSASMFTRIIKRMNMIFWTGTSGNGLVDYEQSGTKLMMEALRAVTHDPEKSAVTIVGGRRLSAIVGKYDTDHQSFTHLTTGGRSALQLLVDRNAIGLECLLQRPGKRPLSLMSVNDYNDFANTTVFLRCDLDIPAGEFSSSNFPLQHVVDTTNLIFKKGARVVVLVSQRGDPDGHVLDSLSLESVKPMLEEMFEKEIKWIEHGLGARLELAIHDAIPGGIILIENIAFYPEECGYMTTESGHRVPCGHDEINAFRANLSSLCDVYVNESFSTLHRAYSSVVGITKKPCIAGPCLKKQIYDYVDMRRSLEGGILLILGSESLSDVLPKLIMLYDVMDTVDNVFLCGNMAAAFKANANSTVKEFRDAQVVLPRIIRKARLNKINIMHVTDVYCVKDPTNPEEEPRVGYIEAAPARGTTQVDMGPQSLQAISGAIKAARFIVLCGPTGSLQYELHMRGTKGVMDQIAAVTSDGSVTAVALGTTTGQFLHSLGHVETFNSYSVHPEPFFHTLMRRTLAGLQVLNRMPPNPLRKLSMEQMNLAGKRVLLRLDLDVPSVEGVVLDTDKLEDAAPTIQYILQQGAECVVLLGHRGEPGGYKNYYLSMEPLVVELNAILGLEVEFIDRPCSRKAKNILKTPTPGGVYLMENLKFYPAESGVDAEPRKVRKTDNESITEVSDLPKDDQAERKSTSGPSDQVTVNGSEGDVSLEEEEESISDEKLSVSDGDGGYSVDSLMYQLMRPKTVKQFVQDLAACGDVFINDDVAHVEEDLVSYTGFELEERGCGLLLAEFLKDSEELSVYMLPGVENLSPAP